MTYPSINPSYTKRSKAKKRKSTGRKGLISQSRHDQAKKPRPAWRPIDEMTHKLKAWRAGKKCVVTIPNPNTNETNKRFIKVSGEQYFGDHKSYYSIGVNKNAN